MPTLRSNGRQLIVPLTHPGGILIVFRKRRVPVPFEKSLAVRDEPKVRGQVPFRACVRKENEIRAAVPFLPKPVDHTRESAPASADKIIGTGADELIEYRDRIEIRKRECLEVLEKFTQDQ